MEDEDGQRVYEYSFPSGQEVVEYNYHVEYSYAAAYEEWIKSIEENGYHIGSLYIDHKQFEAGLIAGLIRPVCINTSEDERYFTCKYWCALEQRYKEATRLDSVDIVMLVDQLETLWSWN